MKIRILRTMGALPGQPTWTEGQEVDVSEADGKRLIEQKLAEPATLRTVAGPAGLHTDAPAATGGKHKKGEPAAAPLPPLPEPVLEPTAKPQPIENPGPAPAAPTAPATPSHLPGPVVPAPVIAPVIVPGGKATPAEKTTEPAPAVKVHEKANPPAIEKANKGTADKGGKAHK